MFLFFDYYLLPYNAGWLTFVVGSNEITKTEVIWAIQEKSSEKYHYQDTKMPFFGKGNGWSPGNRAQTQLELCGELTQSQRGHIYESHVCSNLETVWVHCTEHAAPSATPNWLADQLGPLRPLIESQVPLSITRNRFGPLLRKSLNFPSKSIAALTVNCKF